MTQVKKITLPGPSTEAKRTLSGFAIIAQNLNSSKWRQNMAFENDIFRMLDESLEEKNSSVKRKNIKRPQAEDDEIIDQPKEYAAILLDKEPFKIGDIVQQKKRLPPNYSITDGGCPAIVIGLYPGQISKAHQGSHELEPADLEIAILDSSGFLARFVVDSRWFELWED